MGLEDLTGFRGNADKLLETALTSMRNMGVGKAKCFIALVTDNPSVMKSFRKKFEGEYEWIIE
ncbi:hypothetical protein AAF712_016835 [Marasmius tenuissimus]|uniref:Uncharacterized protein n=1 Tax=Marasmius tenuissimus TaxID=585030 RepID=A0ABR2Z559_9AGAR